MNLFNSKPIQQPEDTLRSIHGIISADMNNQFSSHFMAWEVQEAIKQRPPPPSFKAPGLDDMPLLPKLLEFNWKGYLSISSSIPKFSFPSSTS